MTALTPTERIDGLIARGVELDLNTGPRFGDPATLEAWPPSSSRSGRRSAVS